MKRFLKLFAWIVGIMAALMAVAVIYILLIFDPNKYKTEITTAVHNATGRDLTIQGDLKLSLFPWLGVETGAMRLSNLPAFGRQPFAKINDAVIRVKLIPLLKKDIEVDTVILHGLYLNLIRNPSGQGNWEDLTTQSGKKSQAAQPSGSTTTAPALTAFAIGGIQLKQATVIWDDRQNGTHYELNGLSLNTGSISPKAPVSVTLATQLKSTKPILNAHVDLSTQALFDIDTQQLQLSGLKLTVTAQGNVIPADESKFTLTTDATLKLAENQYRLNKLRLLASLQGDQLPGKQIDATLDGDVALDLNKGTLNLSPLNLEAWNVKINGFVHGERLLDAPQFTGSLKVNDFNVRKLLGHFSNKPLNTADAQALSNADADLKFKASSTNAEIPNLEIKIDQTRITGKAAIKEFSHPSYRFQLAVDQIDADRYLPPATADKIKPASPATAAGAGATELPLAMLRNLNVDGALTVGKLKITRLKLQDIKLGIKASSGIIRAHPLEAQLYGGHYRGDLQLDARGKSLQLGMNENLSDIEIGPMTQDLLQKDLVAGTGNVRLKLTGTGVSPDELKRTVSGNIGFSLRNGRVNGVNLLQMIQKDYVKYIQGLAINPGKLNQTVFSKFSATATVKNGLIKTNDLALNSAQLDVKGRGTVNLVNEHLAMHLDATPRGQLSKQLGQFKNTIIPIRVEGTLSAPRFATDLDALLKQQVKARLEKEKQKAKQELQQKLKQKQDEEKKKLKKQLENSLKNLFK